MNVIGVNSHLNSHNKASVNNTRNQSGLTFGLKCHNVMRKKDANLIKKYLPSDRRAFWDKELLAKIINAKTQNEKFNISEGIKRQIIAEARDTRKGMTLPQRLVHNYNYYINRHMERLKNKSTVSPVSRKVLVA